MVASLGVDPYDSLEQPLTDTTGVTEAFVLNEISSNRLASIQGHPYNFLWQQPGTDVDPPLPPGLRLTEEEAAECLKVYKAIQRTKFDNPKLVPVRTSPVSATLAAMLSAEQVMAIYAASAAIKAARRADIGSSARVQGVVVHGGPGNGKSYFLLYLEMLCLKLDVSFHKSAPTWSAVTSLKGNVTFQTAFGFFSSWRTKNGNFDVLRKAFRDQFALDEADVHEGPVLVVCLDEFSQAVGWYIGAFLHVMYDCGRRVVFVMAGDENQNGCVKSKSIVDQHLPETVIPAKANDMVRQDYEGYAGRFLRRHALVVPLIVNHRMLTPGKDGLSGGHMVHQWLYMHFLREFADGRCSAFGEAVVRLITTPPARTKRFAHEFRCRRRAAAAVAAAATGAAVSAGDPSDEEVAAHVALRMQDFLGHADVTYGAHTNALCVKFSFEMACDTHQRAFVVCPSCPHPQVPDVPPPPSSAGTRPPPPPPPPPFPPPRPPVVFDGQDPPLPEYVDCQDILGRLLMVVGGRKRLRRMVSKPCYLVNGSRGRLVYLYYSPGRAPPMVPDFEIVEFQDYRGPHVLPPSVVNKVRCMFPDVVASKLVPLPPHGKGHRLHGAMATGHKSQLQTEPCDAMSFEHLQGMTLGLVWLNLGPSEPSVGNTLVALSRGKDVHSIVVECFPPGRLQNGNATKPQHLSTLSHRRSFRKILAAAAERTATVLRREATREPGEFENLGFPRRYTVYEEEWTSLLAARDAEYAKYTAMAEAYGKGEFDLEAYIQEQALCQCPLCSDSPPADAAAVASAAGAGSVAVGTGVLLRSAVVGKPAVVPPRLSRGQHLQASGAATAATTAGAAAAAAAAATHGVCAATNVWVSVESWDSFKKRVGTSRCSSSSCSSGSSSRGQCGLDAARGPLVPPANAPSTNGVSLDRTVGRLADMLDGALRRRFFPPRNVESNPDYDYVSAGLHDGERAAGAPMHRRQTMKVAGPCLPSGETTTPKGRPGGDNFPGGPPGDALCSFAPMDSRKTLGDGNCVFHSVFGEGEGVEGEVNDSNADLRRALWIQCLSSWPCPARMPDETMQAECRILLDDYMEQVEQRAPGVDDSLTWQLIQARRQSVRQGTTELRSIVCDVVDIVVRALQSDATRDPEQQQQQQQQQIGALFTLDDQDCVRRVISDLVSSDLSVYVAALPEATDRRRLRDSLRRRVDQDRAATAAYDRAVMEETGLWSRFVEFLRRAGNMYFLPTAALGILATMFGCSIVVHLSSKDDNGQKFMSSAVRSACLMSEDHVKQEEFSRSCAALSSCGHVVHINQVSTNHVARAERQKVPMGSTSPVPPRAGGSKRRLEYTVHPDPPKRPQS